MVTKVFKCVLLTGILTVILCISECNGQTYDNMTKLRTDLLTGYDPDIIPLQNQSTFLELKMAVQYYGIVEVDSVKGILTLVAGAFCQWTDQKLVWNSTDYGGISKMVIKQSAIWTPVIALGTPIEFQQLSKPWVKATVYSHGLVNFGIGDVLQSSCTMNMRFWPFDKQVCRVVFFPMDYTIDMLQIVKDTPGFVNTQLVKNSEWTLEDYACFIEKDFYSTMLVFVLKLKRQSTFYVLSIILPLAGMFVISSLVFMLPQESGERVSYSITITLALAVFLTVVADEMPKSSEPMSLMCIFILLGIINSLIIMVIVILNMRWYFKSDKTSPGAMHKTLVRISACQFRNKVTNSNTDKSDMDRTNKMALFSNSKSTNIKRGDNNDILFVKPREITELNETDDITWKDVSNAVDILAFWIFLIFSLVSCFVSLFYLSMASYYEGDGTA